MPDDSEVPTSQMLNERIEPSVFGDDMEIGSRITGDCSPDVVGKRKIEGILSRGLEPYELHRSSMLHQPLNQLYVQLGLSSAHQEREVDRFSPDHRQVNVMNVLEINEDVVVGWGDVRGFCWH